MLAKVQVKERKTKGQTKYLREAMALSGNLNLDGCVLVKMNRGFLYM